MELRTRLVPVGSRMSVDGDPADAWRDAKAAHALVRAIAELEADPSLENCHRDGAAVFLRIRAGQLMREWGFNEHAGGE